MLDWALTTPSVSIGLSVTVSTLDIKQTTLPPRLAELALPGFGA